jgi:hypothetical protein
MIQKTPVHYLFVIFYYIYHLNKDFMLVASHSDFSTQFLGSKIGVGFIFKGSVYKTLP